MGLLRKLFGGGKTAANPAATGGAGESAMDSLATRLERMEAPALIDFDALHQTANTLAGQYAAASPFPHILLEDFISRDVVRRVLAEFPGPEQDLKWRRVDLVSGTGEPVQDRKLGFADVQQMGDTLRELLWELNSGTFLRFLEKLTGIEGLIADPHMQGGGIHQVLPGGVLAVHADFSNHPRFNLDRRINVLLYLNEDWPAEYGGELELWSSDMQRCERRIRPLAGRCVIFNTTADSYHGHPRPLTCPEGRTRKSLALYYYTRGREDEAVAATAQTGGRNVSATELPDPE